MNLLHDINMFNNWKKMNAQFDITATVTDTKAGGNTHFGVRGRGIKRDIKVSLLVIRISPLNGKYD